MANLVLGAQPRLGDPQALVQVRFAIEFLQVGPQPVRGLRGLLVAGYTPGRKKHGGPDEKEAEERGQRGSFRIQNSDPGLARNRDYKGKGLQLEFTVEDEGVFTTPWSAAISYRRPLGQWPEMVCAETRHGYSPGKDTEVPTAEKPDF